METVLEVSGLSKSFGKSQVLRSISFSIRSGEVFSLLGLNGAGKSTTLRIILGLLQADRGSIHVLGQPAHQMLHRVGAVLEMPSFYPHLTAADNLRALNSFGWRSGKVDPVPVLELVGLGGHSKKPVRQFSLGMKQRLAVALAMSKSPKLLILDEPTNGLDVEGIVELRGLIQHIRQLGTGILLCSHSISEVEQVSDRIALLHQGHLRPLEQVRALGTSIRMVVHDANSATAVLRTLDPHIQCKTMGRMLMAATTLEIPAKVLMDAIETAGIAVQQVSVGPPSLEEVLESYLNKEKCL